MPRGENSELAFSLKKRSDTQTQHERKTCATRVIQM